MHGLSIWAAVAHGLRGSKENMKKTIYILLAVLAVLGIICFGGFYLIKSNAVKQLEEKNSRIEVVWKSIFQRSSERLKIIERLSQEDGAACNTDSLRIATSKNLKERNARKVDSLWTLDYNTNKQYLKVAPCYADKVGAKEKLELLQSNADQLNEDVETYKALVAEFNLLYSTFPNVFFAKEAGFERRKYFDLKYGMDNEELYKEKRRKENWIKTGKLDN